MKQLQLFLAHCNIILGMMFIVLLIINMFNSSMQFLSGSVTNWFLLLFCLCAVPFGILSLVLHRKACRARIARSRIRHMN